MEVVTRTFRQTQNLGKKLAAKIKDGGIVCLYGDLGSGKTTFTQGFAQGLGLKHRIVSPTFIIARQYNNNFFHVDLYRLTSLDDARAIGLEEMWTDPKNIVIIEWPEIVEKILPKAVIKIHITVTGPNLRKFEIKNCEI